MNNLKKSTIFLFIFAFVLVSLFSNPQIMIKKRPVLKIGVKAELKSSTKFYVGVCPVKVKMMGVITVPAAMTVKYRFQRSDGTSSRLTSLMFRVSGSKILPFTWTLGKDYKGWVELIVKTKSGDVRSNRFQFSVDCNENDGINPVSGDNADIHLAKDLVVSKPYVYIKKPIRDKNGKIIKYVTRISYKISNMGIVETNACIGRLIIKHNGKIFLNKKISISSISPGSLKLKKYNLIMEKGEWVIMVFVDTKNQVKETNEYNNSSLVKKKF